ncbi:non-specific lipid-transfer protein 1 [Capsicum annuum]|nr:non-specific lipid-transfer protein 1 [Capsicum annuum]
MKGVAVVLVLVVLAVAQLAMAARLEQQGGLACGHVDDVLGPCYSLLEGLRRGRLDSACCTGFRTMIIIAQSTEDRRSACNCAKAAVNRRNSSINEDQSRALASKCGVSFPFYISRTINCDTVS